MLIDIWPDALYEKEHCLHTFSKIILIFASVVFTSDTLFYVSNKNRRRIKNDIRILMY